jgi:hypothetical protein
MEPPLQHNEDEAIHAIASLYAMCWANKISMHQLREQRAVIIETMLLSSSPSLDQTVGGEGPLLEKRVHHLEQFQLRHRVLSNLGMIIQKERLSNNPQTQVPAPNAPFLQPSAHRHTTKKKNYYINNYIIPPPGCVHFGNAPFVQRPSPNQFGQFGNAPLVRQHHQPGHRHPPPLGNYGGQQRGGFHSHHPHPNPTIPFLAAPSYFIDIRMGIHNYGDGTAVNSSLSGLSDEFPAASPQHHHLHVPSAVYIRSGPNVHKSLIQNPIEKSLFRNPPRQGLLPACLTGDANTRKYQYYIDLKGYPHLCLKEAKAALAKWCYPNQIISRSGGTKSFRNYKCKDCDTLHIRLLADGDSVDPLSGEILYRLQIHKTKHFHSSLYCR